MENIEINGDFITIRTTTFNLNDLISFKPQSLVSVFIPAYRGEPKETARDFPKILVQTKTERLEFAYTTDKERDEALRALNEKIKIYQANKATKTDTPSNISINVADSSNVSIVHQSSGVTITNKQVEDAKNVINQIREELEKIKDTHNEEAYEIAEALVDMEAKIERKERIPKLTFKSFLETSSNLSSIASLAMSLGQIIGMVPGAK